MTRILLDIRWTYVKTVIDGCLKTGIRQSYNNALTSNVGNFPFSPHLTFRRPSDWLWVTLCHSSLSWLLSLSVLTTAIISYEVTMETKLQQDHGGGLVSNIMVCQLDMFSFPLISVITQSKVVSRQIYYM